MDQLLKVIFIHLRSMNLFYHNCHITIAGPTSVADHKLFGKFYKKTGKECEAIGKVLVSVFKDPLDMQSMLPAIARNLAPVTKQYTSPQDCFNGGEMLENELLRLCQTVEQDPTASVGIKELTGDIAVCSQKRLYKINQRLKSSSPFQTSSTPQPMTPPSSEEGTPVHSVTVVAVKPVKSSPKK